MLLAAEDVHTYYGHMHVLKGISIEIDKGQIVAIVGANGAGKTTLLKTLCRIVPSRQGKIVYQGMDITRTDTESLVRLGISFVPEERGLFADMTVWENLELGAYACYRSLARHAFEQRMEDVYRLFPRLLDRRKQLAGTLSGGEQQMLAIGRALMAGPKLLLLDEPSNGLSPLLVKDLFGAVQRLRENGVTVLLVEQSAAAALAIADRAYVLRTGEVVLSDEASHLRGKLNLRDAYLGKTAKSGTV